MAKRSLIWLGVAAITLGLSTVFFATATYGDYGDAAPGLRYLRRPPVANIMWGPKERFMVQGGVNVVGDQGYAQAGNVIEFPISPTMRVSARLFSFRWLPEEWAAWKSNHGLAC